MEGHERACLREEKNPWAPRGRAKQRALRNPHGAASDISGSRFDSEFREPHVKPDACSIHQSDLTQAEQVQSPSTSHARRNERFSRGCMQPWLGRK